MAEDYGYQVAPMRSDSVQSVEGKEEGTDVRTREVLVS